jgi:hypothetical protein
MNYKDKDKGEQMKTIRLTAKQSLAIHNGVQEIKIVRNHTTYYLFNYRSGLELKNWGGNYYTNIKLVNDWDEELELIKPENPNRIVQE